MAKYIFRYGMIFQDKFELLDYENEKLLVRLNNKEVKQFPDIIFPFEKEAKAFSIVYPLILKKEKKVNIKDHDKAKFKDFDLDVVICRNIIPKKSYLTKIEYTINYADGKQLAKISYLGFNNKWLIESDFEDLRKLTLMFSKIFICYEWINAMDVDL